MNVSWLCWKKYSLFQNKLKTFLSVIVSCKEIFFISDSVIYSGHRNGNVMSWQNIEDGVNCELEYKHDRRVTSITGLDMGRYIPKTAT